jgi:hypothetical protein
MIGFFSNNITQKVRQAVSGSTGGTATLFTCGASGWALTNVQAAGAGVTITVGGQAMALVSGTIYQVVVGPSQAVAVSINGGAVAVVISGVEFINSP